MYHLPAALLGCIAATTSMARDVGNSASERPKRESVDTVVPDAAQQRALRVRGMKAAIADIENNQLWILNEVRARDGLSGQACSLQLTLSRELHMPTDDGISIDPNVPHPSILDQDVYAFAMPLAVFRGYNDVMWAEIEHRHGVGTRKRIESLAAEPRVVKELPAQRDARRRNRQILLAPEPRGTTR
ncbi:MAG: hypothetical protein RJS97_08870 [Parvibaculaceae bacterium]